MAGTHGFVKINADIPVRYKFLSKTVQLADQEVHAGHTNNISGSGLELVAKIPDGETIHHLLAGGVFVGLNITLPSDNDPIKTLSQLIYLEPAPEVPGKCAIGLKFMDMAKEDSDRIMRYTIRAQITKKVQRPM